MLASSATLVAIVTVDSGGNVSVDRVLQGNPNDNVYPPTVAALPRILTPGNLETGRSYLIFTSSNRGGSCMSALFGYDPAIQVATFMSQWTRADRGTEIPLSGRVVTIPARIDLASLRSRMYPTGAVAYPTDTAEWFCPGP